jgi:hypothetical protein
VGWVDVNARRITHAFSWSPRDFICCSAPAIPSVSFQVHYFVLGHFLRGICTPRSRPPSPIRDGLWSVTNVPLPESGVEAPTRPAVGVYLSTTELREAFWYLRRGTGNHGGNETSPHAFLASRRNHITRRFEPQDPLIELPILLTTSTKCRPPLAQRARKATLTTQASMHADISGYYFSFQECCWKV